MAERESKHTPVLVNEVVEWLITDTHGIYIDGTVGAAGHSIALLRELSDDAVILGIDADSKTLDIAEQRLAEFPQDIYLANTNYSHMAALLQHQGFEKIHGILLDLGLSSYQIDIPERGFSYMQEGPLDMRFSTEAKETAAKFINTATMESIKWVLQKYGEERFAKKIAQSIITHRPMRTTSDLRHAVEQVTPSHQRIKTLARVFQGIRIYINRELEVLEKTLESMIPFLSPGGRIAVISYHSLEDRIAKNVIKRAEEDCICPPDFPVCVCDHEPTLQNLTRTVIIPSSGEQKSNPRSRSAKMRVAERI